MNKDLLDKNERVQYERIRYILNNLDASQKIFQGKNHQISRLTKDKLRVYE